MGNKAKAVTGCTGKMLYGDIDISGGGMRADMSYLEHPIYHLKAKGDKWTHCQLVDLLNSNINSLNLLGHTLEKAGYSLFDDCKYAMSDKRNANVYFLNIEKLKLRIEGNKIYKIRKGEQVR